MNRPKQQTPAGNRMSNSETAASAISPSRKSKYAQPQRYGDNNTSPRSHVTLSPTKTKTDWRKSASSSPKSLNYSSSSSSSSAAAAIWWWRITTSRLPFFLMGVIVGAFLIRPNIPLLSYYSSTNHGDGHHYYYETHWKEGLSRSKSTFLQSSQNASSVWRTSKRLGNRKQDATSSDASSSSSLSSSSATKETPVTSPAVKEEEKSTSGLTRSAKGDSDPSAAQLLPPPPPPEASPTTIVDFERQPKVVIATKIHGPPHMKQLIQSMCLLKAAYNHRVRYDVIVFMTLPISTLEENDLRQVVHPAHLEIVLDAQTLGDQIKAMSPEQVSHLVTRCQVNSTEELFWWTRCCEEGSVGACMPLAYSWQSEFRSLHLWQSPALKPYKYMLWYDSDAMATQVWHQDPVAFLIRNNLKVLFNNFPQGKSAGEDLQEKLVQAYNETICKLKLVNGHLEVIRDHECRRAVVANIHGFFHITDLDFYRNDENLRWSRIMIGNHKFSRRWDDQLAVTVPAALRAPHLAWDMNYHNITLNVYHNGVYDGKRTWKLKNGKTGGGYQKWWNDYSAELFPEAIDSCQEWIRNPG